MSIQTVEQLKKASKNKYHCDCQKCCDILADEIDFQPIHCGNCKTTKKQCNNLEDSWYCCKHDYGEKLKDMYCKKCSN